MLNGPVARHVNENVGDVEDQEGDVEAGAAGYVKVFRKPDDSGVADIAAVYEGEEPIARRVVTGLVTVICKCKMRLPP